MVNHDGITDPTNSVGLCRDRGCMPGNAYQGGL